ncbi:3'-5' exonuclease [Streptomyces sp. NPDC001076]
MIPIAFVDVETTHLSAEIGEAWEVAVILREFEDDGTTTDTEYVWEFSIDPETVDPEALRVGRWHERRQLPARTTQAAFTGSIPAVRMSRAEAVKAIVNVLSGAVLVGSNPAFDDRFLRKLVGPGNAQWHYRPYDIVQLAAAKIGAQQAGPLPWPTHAMSRAVGVEPPSKEVAHTALGDARWARDVHDAATRRQPYEVTVEGRAQHAMGLYIETAIKLEDARRTIVAMHAAAIGMGFVGTIRGLVEDVSDVRERAEQASAAVELARERCQAVRDREGPGGMINASQILGMLSPTWPDGNYEASAPGDAPSTPVGPDRTRVCTCSLGEPCGCDSMEPDDDQEDDEAEETGDSDGDVLDLIGEIAARLTDAADGDEYHAVGLISDLANGRKTVAEARAELAELTFRHV